jgi:hypothetical protein
MKRLSLSVVALLASAASVWAGCPHMGGAAGGCPTSSSGGVALYLVALVLGYWVLLQAEKEGTKSIKTVGRVVAAVVLIVSLFGLLCKGGAGWCRYKGSCGTKAACPMMGQATPGQPIVETPAK